MIKKFLSRFSHLPTSNKSMICLMWIYGVGTIITNIFVNIYVYKINQSFYDVAIYNILFYTCTSLGFSGIGYLMSCKGYDIKNMYYVGYFLFVLSFTVLFIYSGDIGGIYIFSILYALGNGAFWNGVHSQELQNIKDFNRDFYSSSISAGLNIVDIVTPIGVAVIFYLAAKLSFDAYIILFGFLPFIYILSFLFIHKVESYIPTKISYEDIRNFFCMKKYKYGHFYFFIGGLKTGFECVLIALVSIILLKNEMNIGFLQGVLAFISSFVVVHFSFKRNPNNRFYYLMIIGLVSSINLAVLSYVFSATYFIIFSLISLFLDSMYRVSEHTYDLSLMDNIKTQESDFYPAMILREILLWFGRMTAIILLLSIYLITGATTQAILQIGLLLMAVIYILRIITIYFWEHREKNLNYY